jgi:Tfp pilus assembly protein PilP
MRIVFFAHVVLALALPVAAAQAPAAAPPAAPSTPSTPATAPSTPGTTPASAPSPAPAPGDAYSYLPDGRRDPFQNLLGTGADQRPTGKRADGAAGLTVAEVTVSGVLESRGALIAMIQAPDRKSYIVRQGDRFLDGTIRSITPQGLTIVQEVNDPLSLVKQREIHKLLRSLESAKE